MNDKLTEKEFFEIVRGMLNRLEEVRKDKYFNADNFAKSTIEGIEFMCKLYKEDVLNI